MALPRKRVGRAKLDPSTRVRVPGWGEAYAEGIAAAARLRETGVVDAFTLAELLRGSYEDGVHHAVRTGSVVSVGDEAEAWLLLPVDSRDAIGWGEVDDIMRGDE